MFMSGGEAATEPAFGSVTVALDIRLPERPERGENMSSFFAARIVSGLG
jgi:hypothetical protein